MKFTIFSFAFLCLSVFAQAQDKTLFGATNLEAVGGFGGPIFQAASINGSTTSIFGGGGGIVLNDFFIGGFGAGTGLDNTSIQSENYDISLGYGGLWLGYSFMDSKILHPYISLQAAVGGVEINPAGVEDFPVSEETVGVILPEVGLELNVADWLKVVGTVGYRWMSELDDTTIIEADEFRNISFGLTLRFGFFGC